VLFKIVYGLTYRMRGAHRPVRAARLLAGTCRQLAADQRGQRAVVAHMFTAWTGFGVFLAYTAALLACAFAALARRAT